MGRSRRPSRQPPKRYSGRHGPPRPQGFTAGGFRKFYDLLLPGRRGREKRAFFNRIAGWMIVVFALEGAFLGCLWLGPLGAIFGLGAGVATGGSFVARGRFYRA
jgi:hypothetical protein